MNLHHVRPEDRRRSGVDSLQHAAWADTQPACFRSEGFAEDLPEGDGVDLPAGGAAPAAAAGWPLLGVALAGVLGVFSR